MYSHHFGAVARLCDVAKKQYAKTQAELAAHFGISIPTVYSRTRTLRTMGYKEPKKHAKGYDIDEWTKYWARNDAFKSKHGTRFDTISTPRTNGTSDHLSEADRHDPGYNIPIAKKVYEEARAAELKRRGIEGGLVDRDTIYTLMARHINHARVIQETIPESIALLIKDGDVREMVKDEAKRILEDSHRALQRAIEGGEE